MSKNFNLTIYFPTGGECQKSNLAQQQQIWDLKDFHQKLLGHHQVAVRSLNITQNVPFYNIAIEKMNTLRAAPKYWDFLSNFQILCVLIGHAVVIERGVHLKTYVLLSGLGHDWSELTSGPL